MQLSIDLPRGVSPDLVKGYCLLHQLESWFRELVYLEIKARFGDTWWVQCEQALKRSKSPGIRPEKSLKADKKHRHMSTPEHDPLWYLSFDALLKIVLDKKLWPQFKDYLTTKNLLRAKFDEIKPIRNRIAHSRSLHKDDLSRIEALLRDLDQGFWKFCTSYNHERGFIGGLRADPVYRHFANREHVAYAEVQPGRWARVGIRAGVDVDMILDYSIRPTTKRKPISQIGLIRRAIYDFTFSVAHTERLLDYPKILTATRSVHEKVLHIFLDSSQKQLRVTFPATIDPRSVISATEAIYNACLRYRDSISYRRIKKKGSGGKGAWREYEEVIRPFEEIAAAWPHYVIPPSHPFAFLGPDMPCRFFSRV